MDEGFYCSSCNTALGTSGSADEPCPHCGGEVYYHENKAPPQESYFPGGHNED